MKIAEKTHTEFPVKCLRHGHGSRMPLTDAQLSLDETILCPKCSLDAVPMNMNGAMKAIFFLIDEVAKARSDIFEIEASLDEEER